MQILYVSNMQGKTILVNFDYHPGGGFFCALHACHLNKFETLFGPSHHHCNDILSVINIKFTDIISSLNN